jgi:hypothetical protein
MISDDDINKQERLNKQIVKNAINKIRDTLHKPIVYDDTTIINGNVKDKEPCEFTKGYLTGAFNVLAALENDLDNKPDTVIMCCKTCKYFIKKNNMCLKHNILRQEKDSTLLCLYYRDN